MYKKINIFIIVNILISALSIVLLKNLINEINTFSVYKKELIKYSENSEKTYNDKKNIDDYINLISIFDKKYQSDNDLIENSIIKKLSGIYKLYYNNPYEINESMGIILKGTDSISYIVYTKFDNNNYYDLFKYNWLNDNYNNKLINSIFSNLESKKPLNVENLIELEIDGGNLNIGSYMGNYMLNIDNNKYRVNTIDFYNISNISVDYIEDYFKSIGLVVDFIENLDLKSSIHNLTILKIIYIGLSILYSIPIYIYVLNILFSIILSIDYQKKFKNRSCYYVRYCRNYY